MKQLSNFKLFVIGCLLATTPSFAAAQDIERIFSKLDQNGNGAIDQDEMPEQGKQRFSNRDKNGDGKVSREEMKAGQDVRKKPGREGDAANPPGKDEKAKKRPGAEGGAGDRFKQLLQRVDKNQNGVLELSELPETLGQRLSGMDKNGDGKLSAEEMKATAGAKGNRPADGKKPEGKQAPAKGEANLRFEKMLEKLPKNKDGLVDLEAIEDEKQRQRLSKLDTNGDQLLDKKELRTMLEKLQSQKPGQPGSDPKKNRTDRKAERGAERSPQQPKRPDGDKNQDDNN